MSDARTRPMQADTHHGEIDLVITWVDGDSTDFQQECRTYSNDPSDLNPERYRDNVEIIRYSLRSVEKHLKWVRRIFLVTKRPQKPAWLNTAHPKIRLVHHDEFFDEPGKNLPTFSSNAIELQLHRIAGLSEYFVYMCDDFLLAADVSPYDLISRAGKIKLMPTWRGFGHVPHMIKKSQIDEMISENRHYYDEVMANRFRHTARFPLDIVYPEFLIAKRLQCHYSHWYARRQLMDLQVGRSGYLLTRLGFLLTQIFRPKFVAISDDMGPVPAEFYVRQLKNFLTSMFPEKSAYEI